MPTATEYATRGKVLKAEEGKIVFNPAATSYEHVLEGDAYAGPVGQPVDIQLQGNARKVMTVPSGGNWVQPIQGPPRIIQGRVRWLSDREMVVQAAALFRVSLPAEGSAIDLNNGQVTVGQMVNVTLMPGVRYAFAGTPATK